MDILYLKNKLKYNLIIVIYILINYIKNLMYNKWLKKIVVDFKD